MHRSEELPRERPLTLVLTWLRVRHLLSKTDNGRTLTIDVGDEIVIELMASAGHEWRPTQVPSGVTVGVERPDAGATRILARAHRAGTGSLVIIHQQPWNPMASDERMELTLVVR